MCDSNKAKWCWCIFETLRVVCRVLRFSANGDYNVELSRFTHQHFTCFYIFLKVAKIDYLFCNTSGRLTVSSRRLWSGGDGTTLDRSFFRCSSSPKSTYYDTLPVGGTFGATLCSGRSNPGD